MPHSNAPAPRRCRTLSRRVLPLIAALLACQLPALAPADPPPPPVTDADIREAITKGVDSLLAARQKDGSWETEWGRTSDRYQGAETAVALYALLHTSHLLTDPRLSPESKELAPAIRYLTNLPPKATYVTALQTNALALLPRKAAGADTAKALAVLRDGLLAGNTGGSFDYELQRPPAGGGQLDLSNTQFGLLGLWAAYDARLPIPGTFWQQSDRLWRSQQNADGGWAYHGKNDSSSVSMTAAGIASLYLLADIQAASGVASGPTTKEAEGKTDPVLDAALAYLSKNFDPTRHNLYTLYAIERVGLASGLRYLGDRDWYAETAQYLVRNQQHDGSWNLSVYNQTPTSINTAFALLVLVRGRYPVAFTRLEVAGPGTPHPRALAHLTDFMGGQLERRLNWQVVTLGGNPGQWADSPILFFSGQSTPNLSREQKTKLRAYLDAGGMIFTCATNGSPEFTSAIPQLAADVTGEALSHASVSPRPCPFYPL